MALALAERLLDRLVPPTSHPVTPSVLTPTGAPITPTAAPASISPLALHPLLTTLQAKLDQQTKQIQTLEAAIAKLQQSNPQQSPTQPQLATLEARLESKLQSMQNQMQQQFASQSSAQMELLFIPSSISCSTRD